jgi:hypothetical protein
VGAAAIPWILATNSVRGLVKYPGKEALKRKTIVKIPNPSKPRVIIVGEQPGLETGGL